MKLRKFRARSVAAAPTYSYVAVAVSEIQSVRKFVFGPAALNLVRGLSGNGSTTCFCLEEIFDVELFALMEGMGFYIRIEDRYCLALPENLTRERVKTVVRSFFERNYQPALSHMATIPLTRVEAWDAKLTKMDEEERIAEQKATLLTC